MNWTFSGWSGATGCRDTLSYLRGIVHHRKFRGHNAENSFAFLTRCRKHFALHEASSAWDFFKLGTMLHYAADAFT